MAVGDFVSNFTALGQGAITLIGSAGTAMMQEPYVYFVGFTLAAACISMGVGLLLKRRGGRKGRR